MPVDIRDDTKVAEAAERCTEHFGGIDILVNNASAISLTGTLETSMIRFDLMFGVNVRGTYCCSQACIHYLKRSAKAGRHPHIFNLGPPLNLNPNRYLRDSLRSGENSPISSRTFVTPTAQRAVRGGQERLQRRFADDQRPRLKIVLWYGVNPQSLRAKYGSKLAAA